MEILVSLPLIFRRGLRWIVGDGDREALNHGPHCFSNLPSFFLNLIHNLAQYDQWIHKHSKTSEDVHRNPSLIVANMLHMLERFGHMSIALTLADVSHTIPSESTYITSLKLLAIHLTSLVDFMSKRRFNAVRKITSDG